MTEQASDPEMAGFQGRWNVDPFLILTSILGRQFEQMLNPLQQGLSGQWLFKDRCAVFRDAARE